MKNSSTNIIKFKGWDCINIFLFVFTIITSSFFIGIIVSCFICYSDKKLGICGIFSSLSSAFFIAWLVRYYDMKKNYLNEEKALETLKPHLSSIISVIHDFYPQFKQFAKVSDKGEISYSNEIIYYYSESSNIKSFIDLNDAFYNASSRLEHAINEVLNHPGLLQCNKRIIELLTKLKSNKFTIYLADNVKFKQHSDYQHVQFIDFHSSHKEFEKLYTELLNILSLKSENNLVELSLEEREEYQKHISQLKGKIPSQNRMYLGNKRIQ